MHSSVRLHREREAEFVKRLNAIGVATLVVDSFGSRNLARVFENKGVFNQRELMIDALSALDPAGVPVAVADLVLF